MLNGWSDDPEDARRRILDLTSLAVKVAGDDAVVLAVAAGALAYVDDNPLTGLAYVDRALALNPGSSTSWSLSGMLRVRAGQLDLGIAQLETSLRLDPASPRRAIQLGILGQARFLQGRFAEAIELLNEAEQLSSSGFLPAFTAASFGHLGQAKQAQAALMRWRTATSQPAAEYARTMMTDPAHRKLFLDGIALAEGA